MTTGVSSGLLWGLAVVGFAVGDAATTLAELSTTGLVETGSAVGPPPASVRRGGHPAVERRDGRYRLRRVLRPSTHATGIPPGLVLLGAVVTGWTLSALLGL